MPRMILSIIFMTTLFFTFGCKEKEKSAPPPPTPSNLKQQAEQNITKDNMDQQLEKIEKEIKQDVNSKE